MTARRVVLGVTLLGLTLAGGAAADLDFGKVKVAERSTAAGDRFLRNDKYAQAEERFRSAIEAEPGYPPAHLGLGSALVAQQRFAEAIEALRDAERRYVAWKTLLETAKMRERKHTIDQQGIADDLLIDAKAKAKQSSGAVSEANPRLVRLIQRLQVEVGKLENVRDTIERIDAEDVAAIPAQVFYLEGISHLHLGQKEDGVEMLEVALMLDEGHALSHYNLAVAMFGAGELEAAQQHLDAAVAAGVTPPPAFVADVEKALTAQGRTPG